MCIYVYIMMIDVRIYIYIYIYMYIYNIHQPVLQQIGRFRTLSWENGRTIPIKTGSH